MCRPGIVPGQKYSPATCWMCGAHRKNRRRCCLACLAGLSRRPQVTQLYHRPTVFLLPTNFSLQFVFISHHLHMYNLPLPSTQKIGIIVKPFVPSTVQYRSSREIWPKNLATAMSTNALFCKKSLLPKCMQAHLPVRKGTAVSWVQPKFGNGDSDEAGV